MFNVAKAEVKEKAVDISQVTHESELHPKVDVKRDNEARERLVTARVGLLLKKPFFGNLATRLTLINADKWCDTAATDGKFFYYNAEFILKLTTKEVEFLVGHETLHVVYDHMGRRGQREPKIWNYANDYLVNLDLVKENVGELIHTVGVLYDRKYDGLASEEVYESLLEEAEKNGQSFLDELADKMLDEHLDPNKDGSGDGDGDEEGDGSPGSGPVKITEEERKALKDEIKEAVLQAAQSAGAGNVPGGVKRMLKELTEPKISWRELIAQQIESTFKEDYTWMRPSRRGWHMDAVMPGRKPGETVDVCVAIDTSGSISEAQLIAFISEVKGIMEQYADFRIHMWCFDTSIHNPQVFTQDTVGELEHYSPGGYGGTDFDANWRWMKENGVEPKKFIVFTDGYPFGSWGDEDYCETVWIIHGNKGAQPPFGIWAHYEDQ